MSKEELSNLQKPRQAEQAFKTKDTPVAKVAPSRPKPTAFVIPSIMVDPGTPKGTLKALANPRKETEIAPEVTSKPAPSLPQIAPVPKPITEPTPAPEPSTSPPTTPENVTKPSTTPAPEAVPKPSTAPTPPTTPEHVTKPLTTPEQVPKPSSTPAPAPVSKNALMPGPSHKPSTAFVAPPPTFITTTSVIEETPEGVDTPAPIETSDTTDGGETFEVQESNEEGTNSSLAVGSSNESRRFSQLPPASAESPNAVKLGHFAVIPTPSKEKIEAPKIMTLGSELQAQESEKSRRFSQLPPASVDSPNAVKVGKFGVVPTPEVKSPVSLSPLGRLLVASAQEEKSRRFSKLPPASADSPNAVKLGSKFTMISREEQDEQK